MRRWSSFGCGHGKRSGERCRAAAWLTAGARFGKSTGPEVGSEQASAHDRYSQVAKRARGSVDCCTEICSQIECMVDQNRQENLPLAA